jgi:hypothetical protein
MMRGLLLSIGSLILLVAGAAFAQDPLDSESDGCVYNRVVYPEGAQLCQSGNLVRCEDGAWSDEGDCPNEAPPAPNSEGGDVEEGDD